jgi:hypothetical protein
VNFLGKILPRSPMNSCVVRGRPDLGVAETRLIPLSREVTAMPSIRGAATDAVEELRLRRWAREHYVAAAARDTTWHSVVLDEMGRRDHELALSDERASAGSRIVPLMPEIGRTLHGPHVPHGEPAHGNVLLRVPDLGEASRPSA